MAQEVAEPVVETSETTEVEATEGAETTEVAVEKQKPGRGQLRTIFQSTGWDLRPCSYDPEKNPEGVVTRDVAYSIVAKIRNFMQGEGAMPSLEKYKEFGAILSDELEYSAPAPEKVDYAKVYKQAEATANAALTEFRKEHETHNRITGSVTVELDGRHGIGRLVKKDEFQSAHVYVNTDGNLEVSEGEVFEETIVWARSLAKFLMDQGYAAEVTATNFGIV